MLVHELLKQGKSEAVAIIDGKNRISYRVLQEKVQFYAEKFFQLGIREGLHVGLLSRNSAEYIYVYMAVAALGAVVVPINFQLSNREVAYIVKDAGIAHLFVDKPLELGADLTKLSYSTELTTVLINEIEKLAQYDGTVALKNSENFSEDKDCVIIYTSGTTGNPKGAVLSHRNIVRDAAMFQVTVQVKATDNVLCVLPMYHCFAWTCAVINPLLCGAAITILNAFAPKETIAVIKKETVSVMYVVPSICSLLARLADEKDLATVRLVVVGGTTLPLRIAEDFQAKFGLAIAEGYGLSEAAPVVAVNPPEKIKVGSIGLPLPDLKIKIVNAAGEEQLQGEIGELIVQGDNIMRGYWNLPEQTAQVLQNGWLHTGDIAYQDEDGYIFIVDRLKDMIISMGENIYPREIEELLYQYPGIIEAAVVGVEDRLRGQAGAAFIVMAENMKLDKRELKEYLKSNLALYKVPRDFKVVESLPKSQTGKILKRVLAEGVK